MQRRQMIAHVCLVVDDYDQAIAYYTQALGFELLEDIDQGHKRWVLVRPQGANECALLLSKASNEAQSSRVGNQTGGRVSFFLVTDNFQRDYARYLNNGVHFVEAPRIESYGTVAVFEDLYGNRWDLLQYN